MSVQKAHNDNEPSIDDQAEGSNCNCENTTLNIELGKITKELREHWFDKSTDKWKRSHQLFFTFLGSLSFTIGFPFFSFVTGNLEFQFDIFAALGLYPIFLLLGLSIFWGWILAWAPRNTGPVRLYLSGLTLPAFILFLILLPLHISGLIGNPQLPSAPNYQQTLPPPSPFPPQNYQPPQFPSQN